MSTLFTAQTISFTEVIQATYTQLAEPDQAGFAISFDVQSIRKRRGLM
jgi:hypothetical protein